MDLESALVDELRGAHAVHTVVLYGSRARGDAMPDSDVDVAGFADVPATVRDARMWNGLYLDAFVHPTELASAPDGQLLKLVGGRVLLDVRHLAVRLLDLVAEFDRRGPPPLADSERRLRRLWAHKMLARARRGDAEGDYRRHWLLFQLLEDWFALRGEWFRGPKLSLAALKLQSPPTYTLFERAFAPGSSLDDVEALVEHVSRDDALPSNA